MTNARRTFLLAFALALPLRAADAPRSIFTVEGTSSASELRAADGTWIGRTTRTRYDFVQQSAWTGSNGHILLTEKFVREERSDREGATARLEVTALKSGAKPYDTHAWTYKADGEEVAFSPWGAFFETTTKGCCGAEDLHRLVDLETGREVAAFSGWWAFLEADVRPLERVVSYLSMMAAGDDSAYKAARESVGVLTLAGRGGVSDRLVFSRTPREDMGTPSVLLLVAGEKEAFEFARLKDATKGRRADEVVRGAKVVLDWGSGLVAKIPVERDGFDLAEAELPKGLKAAREKRDGRNPVNAGPVLHP